MGNSMILPAEETRETRKQRVQNSIIKLEKRTRSQLIRQALMERGKALANEYAWQINEEIDNSTQENFIIDLHLLPYRILNIVAKFLYDEINIWVQISPCLYYKFNQIIHNDSQDLENNFGITHRDMFIFKRSYTNIRPIQTIGQSGFCVDRVLVIEPLPWLVGKTVTLRYYHSYEIYNDYLAKNVYRVDFKVDIVSAGKRSLWIHKDDNVDLSENQSYTAQIQQCCIGDEIEIGINLLSLAGIVDAKGIRWDQPIIDDTKEILGDISRMLSDVPMNTQTEEMDVYKKVLKLDLLRRCEMEHSWKEYLDYEYYLQINEKITIDQFSPFLKLISCQVIGTDMIFFKNIYQAMYPGLIPDSISKLGLGVQVVPKKEKEPLVTEVKKLGYLIDRKSDVQMRVGDILVLYICKVIEINYNIT